MAASLVLWITFLSYTLCVFGLNITWKIDDSLHMPLSDAVSGQLICHLDDTIFFIGGQRMDNGTLFSSHAIYRLDNSKNEFEMLSVSLPNNTNSTFFASNYVCHNQSIYMFVEMDVYILDTLSLNFTQLQYPLSAMNVMLPCAALNKEDDIIYVIGGANLDTGNNSFYSSQVLAFDVQTNTFMNTSIASLPYGSFASMCNVINDGNASMLYVFGGETDDMGSQNILEYDDMENKWYELKNVSLTQNRSYTNSIYDEENNIVFIVGGGSNTTDIFYVSNSSVLSAFGDDLPYDPISNTVSSYGDKIFVWGGCIAKDIPNVNEIYVFDFGDDDDKKTTWTTIGIVSGICVLMLCCGCTAYALCGRDPKTNQDMTAYKANGINYQ